MTIKLYQPKGSSFWWYDFTVDGKRFRKTTKRTVKNEARDVARQRMKEVLDRRQLGWKPELTLADALRRHLSTTMEQKDWQKNVRRADKMLGTDEFSREHLPHRRPSRVDRALHALPGTRPIHKLENEDVSGLVDARKSEGMAANTIRLELALLDCVLNRARREWRVQVPEKFGVKKPKATAKMRWLTVSEANAYLAKLLEYKATAEGDATKNMIQDVYDLSVLILDTGARYSEAAELVWSSVDTDQWASLTLRQDKTGKHVTHKITSRLRTVLKARHEREDKSDRWIFPSRIDPEKPRSHSTKIMTRALLECGANAPAIIADRGKATPHSFRDTYASWLRQGGLPIEDIKEMLGHTTITMTMKYAHLAPAQGAARAAQLLESALAQAA